MKASSLLAGNKFAYWIGDMIYIAVVGSCLVSSVRRVPASNLRGPRFKFQQGTVGGPATILNYVGFVAKLKSTLEVNPVSESKQGPFECVIRLESQ